MAAFRRSSSLRGPRPGALVALVALGVLLAASASGCEPAPTREWTPADHVHPTIQAAAEGAAIAPEEEPAATAEDAELRAARALWLAACASCHGREGRGDGPKPPPGARVPDLTLAATLAGKNDEQLAAVIQDGRGMMPAFGKQIVPAGITALVRHVRALGSDAGPVGDAPAPAAIAPEPAPATAPVEGAR